MAGDSRFDLYFPASPKRSSRNRREDVPILGYLRNTLAGKVWVVDWRIPAGARHGGTEIRKRNSLNPLVDKSLEAFSPAAAAIIDTETTGLAGGTGTYAFIIGAGFWEKNTLVVRQYLMREFNEEPAQLRAFAEDCRRQLISFNGKCFDLPLLANRYRINRLNFPLETAAHLDMLFCSRRIWKRHCDSFRLVDLEKRLLGFARTDDVPSHMIPSIFFDYLQNRDETLLYPILNHNRDDILSLHQLTIAASETISNLLEKGGNDDDLILSTAELLFMSGRLGEALHLLGKINPSFASKPTLIQSLKIKAYIFKKLCRWEAALDTYLQLARLDRGISALVESAKLWEHRLKNPAAALDSVRRAEIAVEFDEYSGGKRTIAEELSRRKGRLLRKLACRSNGL